jgi:hypothetical protein
MTARPIGEIAAPMFARWLSQRRRIHGFHEHNDESWLILPALVWRNEFARVGIVLAWGPHRWGVAWRRFP